MPSATALRGSSATVNGQAGFLGQHLVEAAQQGAAASEDDAALDEIGGEFRRATLERDADRLDDDLHRLGHGFADFLRGDGQCLGQSGDEIAAFDFHCRFLFDGVSGTDLDLDVLGGALADHEIVRAAHVVDDALVELIACDADAAAKKRFRRAR